MMKTPNTKPMNGYEQMMAEKAARIERARAAAEDWAKMVPGILPAYDALNAKR